jgi:hypothetical protein
VAVLWGGAMTVNLIWPRQEIYNSVAPFEWYRKKKLPSRHESARFAAGAGETTMQDSRKEHELSGS